jgi:hypothetical protein
MGFFAKEMNAGIAEWKEARGPLHSARVAKGEMACECSIGLRPASAAGTARSG